MKNEIIEGLMSNLQPWIEQFTLSIPHLEEKTRRTYYRITHRFVACLDKNAIEAGIPTSIDVETITGWIKEMLSRYGLYTVMNWVYIIAHFLSFLKDKGVLEENPLERLQKQYPRKGLKGVVLAMKTPSPQEALESLKLPDKFISPLGRHMQEFIALGQAQGKKYQDKVEILGRFDRFLMTCNPPPQELSEPVINKWLDLFQTSSAGNRYIKFRIVRQFSLYLQRFSPQAYVPDLLLRQPPPASLPYIYSRAQIVALLQAARQLKPSALSPYRPQTFYTLFLLLYTTGMRLGEALRLQLGDIDNKNQLLCIRETKFCKSRLVPLSSSMMRELEAYLQLRLRFGTPVTPQSPLFQNPHRKSHYSKLTVEWTFWKMLKSIGLKPNRKHNGPCIHGLRHTMATHRLEDWYRQGEYVPSKLEFLSTYLGHVKIASTQRYLTITTELLEHASWRFNQYFTPTTGETKDEKR